MYIRIQLNYYPKKNYSPKEIEITIESSLLSLYSLHETNPKYFGTANNQIQTEMDQEISSFAQ